MTPHDSTRRVDAQQAGAAPSAVAPPARPDTRAVRVLIVDDSSFMRRALSQMLSTDPALRVIDTAKDGQEALDKIKSLRPDVVTLDIEMPVLDGLSALRRIKVECQPAPAVLMCSSLTSAGSHEALKAMRLGAADVIAKDGSNFTLDAARMRDELIAKIKAIAAGARASGGAGVPASSALASGPGGTTARAGAIEPGHRFRPDQFDLLVIGSSTGGPPVLETILSALPADLTVPVVVAQHMPLMFTKSLAERLDEQSSVSVVHGEDRMPLHAGTVYVIPGGSHGRVLGSLGKKLTLEVSPEPSSALYKPAVNELYASAARACGPRTLGVILTGMGDDGLVGARELKGKGGMMIAQDMPSCVVYGMPKAVAQAGLADGSMSPTEIAAVLSTLRPALAPARAA